MSSVMGPFKDYRNHIEVIFDLCSPDHGLLHTPLGICDIYGDTAKELREEAHYIASTLGLVVTSFNFELPDQ